MKNSFDHFSNYFQQYLSTFKQYSNYFQTFLNAFKQFFYCYQNYLNTMKQVVNYFHKYLNSFQLLLMYFGPISPKECLRNKLNLNLISPIHSGFTPKTENNFVDKSLVVEGQLGDRVLLIIQRTCCKNSNNIYDAVGNNFITFPSVPFFHAHFRSPISFRTWYIKSVTWISGLRLHILLQCDVNYILAPF